MPKFLKLFLLAAYLWWLASMWGAFVAHAQTIDIIPPIGTATKGMLLSNDGTKLVWTKGTPGPQGPAGVQGKAGPAGVPGPQGSAGPAGVAGPVGPAGPIGPVGASGMPGAPGPQGLPGMIGPQGVPGPVGANGPQGLQGIAGTPGPAGAAGPQGLQGFPGAQGATGPAGPIGPAGPAGPQGPVGPQGPPGQGGTGGSQILMASQLGDLQTLWVNAQNLAVGPNCSYPTPCNVGPYQFTSGAGISLGTANTGQTGTVYIYVDKNGALDVGGTTVTPTCTGCVYVAGVNAFPPGSTVRLATWHATNGTWDMVQSDWRSWMQYPPTLGQGDGIVVVPDPANPVGVQASVDPQVVATRVPAPASSTSPGLQGQYATDLTWLYICVAPNQWARTAIGGTW